MPGPPPKRSSQRRRRNVEGGVVESARSDGLVRGPELTGEHSEAAQRFYEALRVSGQAQFFEATDWAYAAEIVCTAIDAYVRKPTAMMLASINSAMSDLLVTEAHRRRARLELERDSGGDDGEKAGVSELDEFRRRLGSG